MQITWNDLISNLEIMFNIYDIAGTGKGTTGNFYTCLALLLPYWCDYNMNGQQWRYKRLLEQYVGLNARPVLHLQVTARQILNNRKEHPKEWEIAVVVSSITCIDLT